MRRLNRASLAVFALTGIFVVLLFVSPFALEPGTVDGLDGGANVVDYPELWRTMPPLVGQVYWFGDFNCHQKASRSLYINGNQMAVCSRDVGIFVGMTLGALAVALVKATPDAFDSALRILPRPAYSRLEKLTPERKKVLALALAFMGLLPMILDGFTQLLTDYESTNSMRLLTGLLAGAVLGIGVCALLESMLAPFPVNGLHAVATPTTVKKDK